MTETLGTDEKRCPFCAEVIRAAAVKCRYCHSDLPVDANSQPGAEPEAEPELPTDFPATGTGTDLRETSTLGEPAAGWTAESVRTPALNKATIVMLALSLVLALGIAGLVISARPDGLRTARNGQVTSASYRSAAMSAAAANASAVLSYGYKTLDANEKAARDVLTPEFAQKYATVMEKAGPKALAAKLTLKATVMSTALISLKSGSAKLLLFVNTITTAAGSDKQQLTQNRVLMTMTRHGGDWVVSKLSPF